MERDRSVLIGSPKHQGDGGIIGGEAVQPVRFGHEGLGLPEMGSCRARLLVGGHLPLAEPDVQQRGAMSGWMSGQFAFPGKRLGGGNDMRQSAYFIQHRFR